MKRLFILSFLTAVVVFFGWGCGKKAETDEKEETIPVKISALQPGTLNKSLAYSGDIAAETEVKVFSKIPDRIEKFYVDESDRVAKGDKIAQIYATTIEQAVRQAEAGLMAARSQYANAEMEFNRIDRLFKENAISKQQYDLVKTQYEGAKSALEQAEAALKSAKSGLSDASITAPISGIIGKRYYEDGDMANPAMPLVSIVQMKRVKVNLDATEDDLGQLALGQEAEVRVRSFPDRIFLGKVAKISPILDPMTRMAAVEVLIDNTDGTLKPGMFATIRITTGKIENALIIPRLVAIENTALERVDGKDQVVKSYSVFVVESDSAKRREIEIQYMDEERIAIASGVEQGEQVVVEGQNRLVESSPVTVIEEEND
ncbi:efflux RND transporter periplasmic adaptor subunit [candidate division KSB1 bacterium]|nr:efflux RND transporter periplasmic adaptor subunit [candidate division KSB1 bacterium]